MRHENAELLKVLEILHRSVVTLKKTTPQPAMPASPTLTYRPSIVNTSLRAKHAKSYYSSDDKQKFSHPTSSNHSKPSSPNPAKVVNLKRTSTMTHSQMSIDNFKNKTKEFVLSAANPLFGRHHNSGKSFSMNETQAAQQQFNEKQIQLVKIRLKQTCDNSNISKNGTVLNNQQFFNEIFYI